jgi:NAD(P)-dependent dehydrogenase (short-subunit alcohol dehydrogenase family)
MDIDSRTAAIVTGGASGLGAATAKALTALGARVAIFDIDETAGRKLATELGCVFVAVDVMSDESVAAGFESARAENGQERILVNCAGTAIAQKTAFRDRESGAIRHHDMRAFERILAINLLGTFRCCAMPAAGMMSLDSVDGERGAIVNTSSIAAEDGQVGQTAYSASKGGIVGLTLPMARDLAREHIRVNTILPGVFGTPLVEANPQTVKDSLAAQIPHPSRFGRPAEFASMAIELCRNAYMNGATVRLDAGIRMPPR